MRSSCWTTAGARLSYFRILMRLRRRRLNSSTLPRFVTLCANVLTCSRGKWYGSEWRKVTIHVTLRHSLPYHFPREQVSTFAHSVTNRGSVEEFNRLLRNRIRILKWDKRAPAVVQQLDRMPIGSGNDRFPCT